MAAIPQKTSENGKRKYFNQILAAQAPESWSKNTTHSVKIQLGELFGSIPADTNYQYSIAQICSRKECVPPNWHAFFDDVINVKTSRGK